MEMQDVKNEEEVVTFSLVFKILLKNNLSPT